MKHNDIAAAFRIELMKRGIPVTPDPWDSVIYTFAQNHQDMNNAQLIITINDTIDYTLPRVYRSNV